MKIATQASAALTHVAELIADIPIAMLTTVEEDGSLVSRPMSVLEMDAAGALWFFTDLRSTKVVHLRVVNLGFSDSAHGVYVSLSGRGEVDTDPGRIERRWPPQALAWFPEGPQSPSLALLKFVPDVADYWDGPSIRMVRLLGVLGALVSAVSSEAADTSEHGSHLGLSGGEADGVSTR